MKRIVVLSGAGISAESGIQTFRDADGLWEGHDVMEVASPQGWNNNKELVLDFYNKRRAQLLEVHPNEAHFALTELEAKYDVQIITQNVDDLHERANNSNILHLHGELLKVRSEINSDYVLDWSGDLGINDKDDQGYHLRPHIVWFGEEVPLLAKAAELIATAEIVIIVGTSLQVYPAAGLISYAPASANVYYVDPKPAESYELGVRKNLKIIKEKASVGIRVIVDELLNL